MLTNNSDTWRDKVDQEKSVELWEGFTVTVDQKLANDFDFTSDFSDARREGNIGELVQMYMALIGGEETYNKIREHIIGEKGYFAQDELLSMLQKVDDTFPKAGNRAQRRSWKPTA